MKASRSFFLLLGVFILLVVAANSFFIVSQTEQALVLRFGKPVAIINEPGSDDQPGLKFKMPFVDSVQMYEKRILVFNAKPMTVILEDQDRLIVDAFVTYRIHNPLQFYQAVRTEQTMNQQLESILEKSLRDTLGRENLSTLLSSKRSELMREIRDRVYRLASGAAERPMQDEEEKTQKEIESITQNTTVSEAEDIAAQAGAAQETSPGASREGFGIEVVDVRIMRTDLPQETSAPIYDRMRSDRQKVAERFRAEGQKESQIIRSEADKERTIMIAEAEKRSQIIRGEGEAESTKIFAQAFGSDEDFYAFYRSMQAYRTSLKKEDTTMIISPDNGFLKYLEKNRE